MSYEYLDSFNADPSILATTLCEFSYNATVVFSQSLGAVTITSPIGQTVAWLFTGLPLADKDYRMTFEADIELVSDPSNIKHTGIFIVTNTGYPTGIRFAHLNSLWQITKFSGMSSQSVLSFTQLANPSFNVGERRRVRCIKSADNYKFYVDGALVADITDASYRLTLPGIFSHHGSINVHSISYQIDGLDISSKILPIRLVFANSETKENAWPGENSFKQIASQSAKKAYGVSTATMLNFPPQRTDFGFIAGQVMVKGVPHASKRVFLFDESMNITAEAQSDASGNYRFDSLPRNLRYLVVATDTFDFDYAPAAADRVYPEPYA